MVRLLGLSNRPAPQPVTRPDNDNAELEGILEYSFQRRALLETALTHPSAVAAGEPAAVSTAYLHETADDDHDAASPQDEPEPSSFDEVLSSSVLPAAAVSVELSPPQPAVARSLRLSPGQPVITVTVRFDDPAAGRPAGLTVVMLKPELFRVAIDTTEVQVSAPMLRNISREGPLFRSE